MARCASPVGGPHDRMKPVEDPEAGETGAMDPVPVVAAGEVPGERIRRSLETYRWLFGEAGWEAARAHAPAIGEALAGVEPGWIDELSLWAAAAGTDLADLLVLNARSEVLSVVRSERRRRGECTVVAEAGRLGQTWDWFGRQRPAMVVLRSSGFLTLTEAGMLAKVGVNRAGLAVGLTYLASPDDGVPAAGSLPVHALLRLLLERSSSVATGLDLLAGHPLSGSACIPLADPSEAVLVERTPAGRSVLPAGVHTNHCLDPVLRRTQGPIDFLEDSEDRLERAAALRAGAATVEEVLADTGGGFHAIDQPPDPSLRPRERTETVMAVIAEPAAGTLRIAPGRPSQTGFPQLVGLDSAF
jgi:isopenicillin-N N-acyltransferase-like protein